jgi:DNA-binding NtrC family response regulator
MLYEQFFTPVLVVDDEPLILRQVCEVATALGYFDVRPVDSYEQARAVLNSSPVGVLITDVALPDGDGRRLALDAIKARPETKVILISGFAAHSLMLAPELREHVFLLEKPFGLRELQSLLTGSPRYLETPPRIRA